MMKTYKLKRIGDHLRNILLPRFCCVCGKRLLTEEEALCLSCLIHLPRTGYHLKTQNPCAEKFYGLVNGLKQATAYFIYSRNSPYRNIITDLKYRHGTDTGRTMGRLIAQDLQRSDPSFFTDTDLIIPLPLSRQKRQKRGYNQSDFIADGIADVTGIQVDKNAIVRVEANDTQTRKGNVDRWKNVKGIFKVKKEINLAQKHILIVDDVLTTGATLTACAAALKDIDGIRVSLLAMACPQEL